MLRPGDPDASRLAAHGVRLVCDLRSARERSAAPNAFWRAGGAELLELDVNANIRGRAHLKAMQDDPGEQGAVELLRLTYRVLPQAASAHLAELFRRILDDHLPLVVHCTAGKDRTGVVIALLLSALGTPREAIYADYMESGRRTNPVVMEATRAIMSHALGTVMDEAALQALCGVREDYLEESFAAIIEEHGGVDAYLRDAAGLDVARRERLCDMLLV